MKDAKEALYYMGQMTDKCLTSLGAIQKDYNDFASLVKRMRDARHKYSALLREFYITGIEPRQSWELQEARKLTKKLESEIDEFLMKLEDMKSSWIKVSDRLPDNDDEVLVYHYKPIYEEWELAIAFYDERLGEFWTTDGYKVHPTYWMPIELPEED